MIRAVALLASVLLGPIPTSTQLSAKRIPLTVAETAGVARQREIISSGVPFPIGQVPKPGNVRLIDPSGVEVPTLVSVRSTWPDKTVKWVTIQFACSLPGNTSRSYQLECGPTVRQKLPTTAQSELAKGFFLTAPPTRGVKLEVDGKPLEQAVVSGAERTRKEILFDAAGPVIAKARTDYADWVSPTFASVFSLTAQTRGGVGEKSQATVYTLRHVSEKASLPITNWEMVLLDRSEIKAVTFGGDRGGHRFAVAATSKFELHQKSTAAYSITSSGKVVASGFRAPGWVTVETADSSVTFAVRDFWQQFPLSIQVDAKRVALRPWVSDKPFAFDQGLAKSYDILTSEGPKGTTGEAVNRAFQSPLFAVCAPQWVASTGVLRSSGAADFAGNSPLEILIEAGASRWMARYGSRTWGSSYAAPTATPSASDEASGLLTQFLRTGKLRHLSAGMCSATFASDSGVNHFSGQPWRVEADGRRIPSPLSHISVDGLLLFSYLTGDPRGLEAAREVGNYVTRAVRKRSEAVGELNLGQALRVLSTIYTATGDEKFLESAKSVVELLIKDLTPGGEFKVRGAANTASTKGVAVLGLMEYMRVAKDEAAAKAAEVVTRSILSQQADISGRALAAVSHLAGNSKTADIVAWLEAAHSKIIEAGIGGINPGEATNLFNGSGRVASSGPSTPILQAIATVESPIWVVRDISGGDIGFRAIALGGVGKFSLSLSPGTGADVNGRLTGPIDVSNAKIEVSSSSGYTTQGTVRPKPVGRSAIWRIAALQDEAVVWGLMGSRKVQAMLYVPGGKAASELGTKVWFASIGGPVAITVETIRDEPCVAVLTDSSDRTLTALETKDRGTLRLSASTPQSVVFCLELIGGKIISASGIYPYFATDRSSVFSPSASPKPHSN